jgi:hypothetical protein
MAQVTKGRTFSNGETITPGKLHEFIDFAQVSNIATADINDAAITGPKLANNAVTTVKITDANVTTAKIADANVTTAKIADAAVTGPKIAAGASISYPVLTGVREAIVNLGNVTGTQTLNLFSGNIFQLRPTGNVTIAFSNIPATGTFVGVLIRHEGDGTARTYTWPANTKWAYGEQPAFTSTNGKFDIISLFTYNGGTNWFGQIIGQNY